MELSFQSIMRYSFVPLMVGSSAQIPRQLGVPSSENTHAPVRTYLLLKLSPAPKRLGKDPEHVPTHRLALQIPSGVDMFLLAGMLLAFRECLPIAPVALKQEHVDYVIHLACIDSTSASNM